ncbi:MAG: protein kinase, partial [Planctomycetes bacterium]|nr:protein kinase [Planctomycetota bacterium]
MMPIPENTDELPGLTLGEPLGQGAFGAVYRARHHALGIDVAVKILSSATLETIRPEQSLREAQLMARLDHPNLLRIFHAGQTDDAIYLVMELMDGGSCKNLRNLSPAQAVAVARQLLSGLQALHDARILHRDIKPANCLHRLHDARIKLADLGIAADWHENDPDCSWAGTIPFMAPELFSRTPRFSPQTDLYALGVTLACLVLPADPFPTGSLQVVRDWIVNAPRPPISHQRPDLPQALARLIDRLMSRDLNERPGSAAAALVLLSNCDQNAAGAPLVPSAAATPSVPTDISTLPPDNTIQVRPRVGAWVLGEVVFSTSNWHAQIVTHSDTGKAARFVQLKPTGPIGKQSPFILAAAERAAQFCHPHIVEVIDWGWRDETAFVVTGAQGRSFHDLLDNGQPLEPHVAIPFMMALADALSYLHGLGYVYQLVDPGAAVVGSDAQSAQLSWPVYCVPAGSPVVGANKQSQRFFVQSFAAPEVLNGQSRIIEPSVDLYGLGATFCCLLTGREAYYA